MLDPVKSRERREKELGRIIIIIVIATLAVTGSMFTFSSYKKATWGIKTAYRSRLQQQIIDWLAHVSVCVRDSEREFLEL